MTLGRVFISYSTQDVVVADRIVETLEGAGIHCWIAPRDIEPGKDWSASIVPAIASAKVVVLLFSAGANGSRQVAREIHLAQSGSGKPVVPFRLEPIEPGGALGFLLAGIQWLDAVDRTDLAIAELVERLRRTLFEHVVPTDAILDETIAESGTNRIGNLPTEVSSFVGREREVEYLETGLRDHHLVAVVGTGGVGKTRLALHVAHRRRRAFPGGAWLVDLSPIADPSLVVSTVAHALGVRELDNEPLELRVARYLSDHEALLVLDNCEHVITASAALVAKVASLPSRARVLCTSRQALHVAGEFVVRLEPLASPSKGHYAPSLSQLEASPAARLFLDRADGKASLATEAERAALAGICRRLDGLPLALELAAARTRVLSLEQIAEAIDKRFRLLTKGERDSTPRHRTLLALIGWSYDMLDAATQALFRRLGALSGPFALPAALALAPSQDEFEVIDQLGELLDRSLLASQGTTGGVQRYVLLESLREFAQIQLDGCGEGDATRRSLARYVRELVATASQESDGAARIDADLDNLRAVLRASLAEPADAALATELLTATSGYWLSTGRFAEGRKWYDALLAIPSTPGAQPRSALLLSAAALAYYREDYHSAVLRGEEALALLGAGEPLSRARAFNTVASAKFGIGEAGDAARSWHEALALFERAGDRLAAARIRNNLAMLEWQVYDRLDAADELYRSANAEFDEAGDLLSIALNLGSLAEISYAAGHFRAAIERAGQSLAIYQRFGNQSFVADRNLLLGKYHLAVGELDASVRHVRLAIELFLEVDQPIEIAESLLLAAEAVGSVDAAVAAPLFAYALARREGAKRRLLSADRKRIDAAARKLREQLNVEVLAVKSHTPFGSLDEAARSAITLLAAYFPA